MVSMANILPRRHIHQECVGYNDRRRGGEENGWKEEHEKGLGGRDERRSARVGRNWVWIVLFESHGGYPIEIVAKLPFWETQKSSQMRRYIDMCGLLDDTHQG